MASPRSAIVATGSYGPKGFAPEWTVPQGAEEADGVDALVRVVRGQIGRGADWIKVYGDYRWGPNGEARPTFSLEELKLIVDTAKGSGRPVVVHASTPEGIRRAVLAGAESIEHGDDATPEVFQLMAQRGVFFWALLHILWGGEQPDRPLRARRSRGWGRTGGLRDPGVPPPRVDSRQAPWQSSGRRFSQGLRHRLTVRP